MFDLGLFQSCQISNLSYFLKSLWITLQELEKWIENGKDEVTNLNYEKLTRIRSKSSDFLYTIEIVLASQHFSMIMLLYKKE